MIFSAENSPAFGVFIFRYFMQCVYYYPRVNSPSQIYTQNGYVNTIWTFLKSGQRIFNSKARRAAPPPPPEFMNQAIRDPVCLYVRLCYTNVHSIPRLGTDNQYILVLIRKCGNTSNIIILLKIESIVRMPKNAWENSLWKQLN